MRLESPRQLLVDVSQYASAPARSGVQRVLCHLAEDWASTVVEARFGFIDDDSYVTGPLRELGPVIASTFRSNGRPDELHAHLGARVQRLLQKRSDKIVPIDDVETTFDAYFLPEPTLRRDNLEVAMGFRRSTSFFMYYDALPLTHPHFFPPGTDGRATVTRYHYALARAENVAFISEAARRTFEQRIARRRPANAIVLRLGADGLRPGTAAAPSAPRFTVVGTIEPRKRHRVVLDAFEQLWAAGRDYALVVIGPRGSEQPELLDRLEDLSRTPRVLWIEQADDDAVSNALARSSAMVFISDAEGYGLPPLEALAAGCPVIVATDLPALEGLPDGGQLRLPTITVEGVCTAVETLADPVRNAAYRRAIRDLPLPTWQQFARDIESWIASVLRVRASGEEAREDT